jgi:transposase
VVTADKAYDSQTARQQIKDEGALPIIPNRRNAIKQAYCPKRFYRQRHKIENFFCRIKDWRRIATRYDKLARNFLAATTLVRRTLLDQAVSPDPSDLDRRRSGVSAKRSGHFR